MAYASLGEALLAQNKVGDAAQKLESVKQEIKKEVVFENHMLFINVCN